MLTLMAPSVRAASPVEAKPKLVGSSFSVLKIWDIDSANESFSADFLIQLTWKDSTLKAGPDGTVDWNKQWAPVFESVNSRDMKKQSAGDYYSITRRGEGYTYARLHGTFDAPMDLRRFPFDEQTLRIQLEPSSDARSGLVFGYQDRSTAPFQDLREGPATAKLTEVMGEAMRIPDWSVKAVRVLEIPRYYPMLEETYSRLELQIIVARKPAFFVWKVFAIIFTVVVLSWLVFYMDPAELGKRITITLTLFLALVAFSVFMTALTPRVGYLTLLDYYVFMGYLMLILACVESVVAHVSHVKSEGWANPATDAGRTLDRTARTVFPVLFVAFHAVLALAAGSF
jgi:hypothetical protein